MSDIPQTPLVSLRGGRASELDILVLATSVMRMVVQHERSLANSVIAVAQVSQDQGMAGLSPEARAQVILDVLGLLIRDRRELIRKLVKDLKAEGKPLKLTVALDRFAAAMAEADRLMESVSPRPDA